MYTFFFGVFNENIIIIIIIIVMSHMNLPY